jgi:hypothetical protein
MPEHPAAESTVRAYVRDRKWAMGLAGKETYVPQDYGWGEEAQVDWYEAYAVLGGESIKVQIFTMRSMKSGAAYHRAYRHAHQQAFFDAHEHAFGYFGGVFRTLRYDNLASAVKKVFRGHTREEHTRFIAFRSHWEFAAEFCGAAQPQEKGGVEGEVGAFRRNHLVPVPEEADLNALNGRLLADCIFDQSRRIGDRQAPVGEMLIQERGHLLPIPKEGFDLAEAHTSQVDAKGCIKTHNAWYSAPLRVGTSAHVRALPSSVEIWNDGRRVAVHERTYERGAEILNLEHYLDVLDKKPGALPRARPLTQWRALGLWPPSFDCLWALWQERLGKHAGTRAMVDLLQLVPVHGWPALRLAADTALSLGCTDASAVKCLLAQSGGAATAAIAPLPANELGSLSRYDRPLPEMSAYDQLLTGQPLRSEVSHIAETGFRADSVVGPGRGQRLAEQAGRGQPLRGEVGRGAQ